MSQPACNNPPIATVGATQVVPEFGPAPAFAPTVVTLDGSASFDPDGNPLTYVWTQILGPSVALNNANSSLPTFTAPSVSAADGAVELAWQLVVSDGISTSAPKFTAVFVVDVNRPPVANAGPPQSVVEGSPVQLDGRGSADPDGDALTYAWTAPAGITLSDATSPTPCSPRPR